LCAALGHTAGAGIVVYGHTHVLMVYRHEEVLLINPGAIAPPAPISRQVIRTVALLYFNRGGFRSLHTWMSIIPPSRLMRDGGSC
jgi:predicted phosphodiesterase